jgi:hypothetical protein
MSPPDLVFDVKVKLCLDVLHLGLMPAKLHFFLLQTEHVDEIYDRLFFDSNSFEFIESVTLLHERQ